MSNNCLIKRIVYRINIALASPLSVSSGDDEWTDSDLLRDKNDNPFVSGSSLAGAMRAYLEKMKSEQCIFGYSGQDDFGKMSSLFLSDLTFYTEPVTGVRDGVKLTDGKVAESGSKYETEIIEANAKGHFFMELVVRENDDEAAMVRELETVLNGIHAGEIRLGSKKTRGFGKMMIESVKRQTYSKENYCEYKDAYEERTYAACENELDRILSNVKMNHKMIHIAVPLHMEGGISIRRYAARKNEPDYEHITDHGVPVIPGSSFAGAIRHRAKTILEEMRACDIAIPGNVDTILNIAFGFVNNKEKKACSSNVIINESVITNATPLTMVRTGVSRFESAVKQGALYCEKTYVNGDLTLEMSVRKGNDPADEKWIVGLLLLAIKDLQNGFLAVGGQTAIGRGIFSANGNLTIDGEEGKEEIYIAELLQNLGNRKEKA